MTNETPKDEKQLMDALEKIGDDMGFEVGKPLTLKEFLELMAKMKKDTNNGKDWGKSQKSMADFYQEKNRKDKLNER